jgi:O-antigen/teichoic acid export membrane protein
MILTRVFSPDAMGEFFFAVALASLVLLLTTFGTHFHLVRAVARDPDRGLDRLGEVIKLRLPLTGLALLVLSGGAVMFAPAVAPVVALTSVFVLVGDFANTFGAYLVGRREFKLRLLIALPGPIALLVTVPLVVLAGATLEQTLLCFIGASAVAVLVGGAVVHARYGRLSLPRGLGGLRWLMAVCFPFLVLEALQLVQFKIDTLMVFWILSSEAAAQYETAYRLLEVSRLAIGPLATIAFPVCALLIARQDWRAARAYGTKVVGIAAAIGLGVMLAGLVGPEWIMVTVWGSAYAGTGAILRVLLLSAPLVFVNLVGIMVANAMGQERRLMWLMAFATICNITMNAIAIPRWGAEGAAWTTLITEIVILIGLAATVRRAAELLPAPLTTQG